MNGMAGETPHIVHCSEIAEVNITVPLKPTLISSIESDIQRIVRPSSKYLRPETIELADTTMAELGRSLGVKQGAFAIDGLISKFYQRTLETDDIQVLQQESGNLVLAEQVRSTVVWKTLFDGTYLMSLPS